MSDFTPLLLFGVHVELSWLLSLSFYIDLMCGPWSTGHVFSQEMVRLNNLDRAIGMVQSGPSWHGVALTFGWNKSTINRLMIRYRETGNVKRSCQEWSYQKDHTASWQHNLGNGCYPLPAADGPQTLCTNMTMSGHIPLVSSQIQFPGLDVPLNFCGTSWVGQQTTTLVTWGSLVQ